MPQLYSERERAALAWAEAVTRLEDQQVADAVYGFGAAGIQRSRVGPADAGGGRDQWVEPLQCGLSYTGRKLPPACWKPEDGGRA